jgi:ferredoxin, 2Fe-2S
MPFVRVEPLAVDIEVQPGESLANAAWRLGYRWPTRCWGQAECMVCRVRVLAGEDCIEPPEDEEINALRRRLDISVDRDPIRLGCRFRVRGEGVVVEKEGVVRPEP